MIELANINSLDSNIVSNLQLYYPQCFEIRKPKHEIKENKLKGLGNLIDTLLMDQQSFRKFWVNGFCRELEKKLGLTVLAPTGGPIPAYSAKIPLGSYQKDFFAELYLDVGLTLQCYRVRIVILNPKMNIYCQEAKWISSVGTGVDTLVVSPMERLYLKTMKKVINFVAEKFENAVFLSYNQGIRKFDKLNGNLPEIDDVLTLENVLFSKCFPLNEPRILIGDRDYQP